MSLLSVPLEVKHPFQSYYCCFTPMVYSIYKIMFLRYDVSTIYIRVNDVLYTDLVLRILSTTVPTVVPQWSIFRIMSLRYHASCLYHIYDVIFYLGR